MEVGWSVVVISPRVYVYQNIKSHTLNKHNFYLSIIPQQNQGRGGQQLKKPAASLQGQNDALMGRVSEQDPELRPL